MGSRTKLLPVLAGLGAVVMLAVVALSWREIAIQYHTWKLRSDPAYVREVIEEPEETVVGEALRRAIATPKGEKTFCRALVLELLPFSRRHYGGINEGASACIFPGSWNLKSSQKRRTRMGPGSGRRSPEEDPRRMNSSRRYGAMFSASRTSSSSP